MNTSALKALRRPVAGLATALTLALAPAACRKEPGPPSAEYSQAHQRFTKLYGQRLDEAFGEPAMAEVEALLQRVPADSVDAPDAQALLTRIREGRARLEAQLREREAAIASARQVTDVPSSGAESPPVPAPAPQQRAEAPDAGPPPAGPQAGTAASELVAGFQGCFRRGQQIDIEGRGLRESWEMADRLACRLEYPGAADKVLIIEAGKVLALLPKDSLKVTSAQPPAPAPDAGR